jgi:hypothetical protein
MIEGLSEANAFLAVSDPFLELSLSANVRVK